MKTPELHSKLDAHGYFGLPSVYNGPSYLLYAIEILESLNYKILESRDYDATLDARLLPVLRGVRTVPVPVPV